MLFKCAHHCLQLQLFLLLCCLSLIPGAMGEHDCDKYCFVECGLAGDPGYGDCRQANINCNCNLRIDHRNILLYIVVISILIIMCFPCSSLCDCTLNLSTCTWTSHPSVARNSPEPVTSNMAGTETQLFMSTLLSHDQYPSSPRTSQRPSSSVAIPMEGSHSPKPENELPPEYPHPPEYQHPPGYTNHVVDVDVDEKESPDKQHASANELNLT